MPAGASETVPSGGGIFSWLLVLMCWLGAVSRRRWSALSSDLYPAGHSDQQKVLHSSGRMLTRTWCSPQLKLDPSYSTLSIWQNMRNENKIHLYLIIFRNVLGGNRYFYHAQIWGDDISVCSFVFNLSTRSQFVSCFLYQHCQI